MKAKRNVQLSVIMLLMFALAKANGSPLVSIGNITIGNTIQQQQ